MTNPPYDPEHNVAVDASDPGSMPPRPVTLAAGTTARCACDREIGWTECGGARQAGFGFLWAWCPRCLSGFVHADTEAGYRAWVAAVTATGPLMPSVLSP